MLSKEQKLEAIYEAMSDKTLSEGCIIFNKISETNDIVGSVGITVDNRLFLPSFDDYMDKDEYKIIGHPVRIGDVLDWFDKNNHNHLWGGNGAINGGIITRQWDHLRLPIDEQSEECIDFVYSLIQKQYAL